MSSDMDGAGGMSEARSALDGWRARGADRVNVTRFRFIEALARRAQAHEGDVRRILDARVAALIADYAAEIERAGAAAGAIAADEGQHQGTPRRGALADLADLLAGRATDTTASGASMGADALTAHRRERSPDLPVLDYFRETWSKFSTEKQLRRSLEKVPENAGPLNSSHLVHRSLSLMRSVSPGYLQHFLSYVEALSWMEHLSGPAPAAPTAVAAQAPRASGAKKSARGKAR